MNSNEPNDSNSAEDGNPYQPPVQFNGMEPALQRPRKLPLYHWPLVVVLIAIMIILMLTQPDIEGMLVPCAVAVLAGGIRTAWVVSTCAKAGYIQASYVGVFIISTFLAFVFQFAASVMFFIVCLAGSNFHTPGVNQERFDQFWLYLSGGVGIASYIATLWLSGWIAIASRRLNR